LTSRPTWDVFQETEGAASSNTDSRAFFRLGRPPKDVRRYHASFSYRAASWTKPRRVVAKVEWHPGELYPRVRFIVTNLSRPAGRVVAFYNQRGTAEQYIKEGNPGAVRIA
jgi:hypothetical protein